MKTSYNEGKAQEYSEIRIRELKAALSKTTDALLQASDLIAFLAGHLEGRIGEYAQLDMLEKAQSWADAAQKARKKL